MELKDVMSKVGKGAIDTGHFLGRKIAEGYNAVDPDVMRHFVQIPLLSYTLFVSRHETISAGKPDGYPPLIFVHGLGGNRGNFLLMEMYLRALGRKRNYKINFDGGQSMEQMAAALADFIKDVMKATGEESVDMVAHSMGGLVARLAVVDYDLADSINTFISLGTPHRGTCAARYANTEHTRAMRPDSEIIKRINSKPWPESIRTVTLWSKNDLLVVPAEAALIDGAEHVEMSPFTHYSYLIDPRCWAAVGKALTGRASVFETAI